MKRIDLCATVLLAAASGACHAASGNDDSHEMAGASLPEHPAEFRIELSGTPCFGSCPTYTLTIDQDGQVTFLGEACVARPGAFSKQVSPKAARAIYDAIVASPYPKLGDRYVDKDDGCDVFTDSPTSNWLVRGDGREKPLKRYFGCEGVAGLDKVDALEPIVKEKSEVISWLSPAPFNCDYQTARTLPETYYRLERLGVPLGLLKLEGMNEWARSFTLEDCAGSVTARGSVGAEHDRLVLLEQARGEITLPAELGGVGSLVLEGMSPGFNELFVATRARGLRADDELEFNVVQASACEPVAAPAN